MSVFGKWLIGLLCAVGLLVAQGCPSICADLEEKHGSTSQEKQIEQKTLRIVCDEIEYDPEGGRVYCRGNAEATIDGQDSKMVADTTIFNIRAHTIDALDNVRIIRKKEVTSGSAFKIDVESDEYLVTQPHVVIGQAIVNCRSGSEWTESNPLVLPVPRLQPPANFKPIYFRLNGKLLFPFEPTCIFRSKFSNNRFHNGLTVSDWGRDKYGIGNALYGSPLNGPMDLLGIKEPTLIVHRFNMFKPSTFLFFGDQFPITAVAASRRVPEELQEVMIMRRDRNRRFFALEHAAKELQILPMAPIEAPVICDWIRLEHGSGVCIRPKSPKVFEIYNFRRARSKYGDPLAFITGVNLRTTASLSETQATLATSNPALAKLYGIATQPATQQPSSCGAKKQVSEPSVNLIAAGDDRYGIKSYIFGAAAFGHYSGARSRDFARYGFLLDARLNRFHLNSGYTQRTGRGSSPSYLDRYLEGLRSANLSGHFETPLWLKLGGGYGYDPAAKATYAKTITSAFGPDDFKVLLNRDVLSKGSRFGFDILYGHPSLFLTGDFPFIGKGWRNERAVDEQPCTQLLHFGSNTILYGEIPWMH